MNNLQRRFYVRSLVDKRVLINDTRSAGIGVTRDARLYISVALRTAAPPGFIISEYELAVAGNRLIHYAPVVSCVGVSRSDVLAYLAEQVPVWKLEIFNDILDESTSSSEESS